MQALGFVASLVMGITLGLMGGGGSILTVPILVYLFAIPAAVSTGYSLFVVGTTALIGSFVYIRQGDIDVKAGLAFAVFSIVGVNFSRGLVLPRIPAVLMQSGSLALTKDVLIMLIFAALMVGASYSMIRARSDKGSMPSISVVRLGIIALAGSMVGMIAGFVGAGGGFLIIPVLVFVAGLSMRIAVGTSLMIIALQSLFGFAGDFARGLEVDWLLLLSVAGFAVAGILVGSKLARKVNEQKLKVAFGWFVLVMGVAILLDQLSEILA